MFTPSYRSCCRPSSTGTRLSCFSSFTRRVLDLRTCSPGVSTLGLRAPPPRPADHASETLESPLRDSSTLRLENPPLNEHPLHRKSPHVFSIRTLSLSLTFDWLRITFVYGDGPTSRQRPVETVLVLRLSLLGQGRGWDRKVRGIPQGNSRLCESFDRHDKCLRAGEVCFATHPPSQTSPLCYRTIVRTRVYAIHCY